MLIRYTVANPIYVLGILSNETMWSNGARCQNIPNSARGICINHISLHNTTMENILLSSRLTSLVFISASSFHSHVVCVKGLPFTVVPDV